MAIFNVSKAWPKAEQFSLTDQIHRSSRSICVNIGEAWAKREYTAHFISKLTDCEGEANETRIWLMFARDCGYLDPTTATELIASYQNISGSFAKMKRQPEKWCTSKVREERAPYEP